MCREKCFNFTLNCWEKKRNCFIQKEASQVLVKEGYHILEVENFISAETF